MQDEKSNSMIEPQFYSLFDKGRQLVFEGFHLANASSYVDKKPRWFVVDIYKTVGGKYIVAGVGRSLVVHRLNCVQMKDKNLILREPDPTSVPCSVCVPSLTENVIHEMDREWAQVSDDPHAVIERLRLKDSDGVLYIPTTSMTALLEAAENDEELKKVFYAPQHID